METWIIVLIVVVVILILALAGFLIYYFVFYNPSTVNPTPTPVTTTLTYGTQVSIINPNTDFGGYLTICGDSIDPDTCSSSVTVNSSNNGTQSIWVIKSDSKSDGSNVLYGDSFYIRSITTNQILTVCGSIGQTSCGNGLGLLNDDISVNAEWRINNGTTGTTIPYGRDIILYNINEQQNLSICGDGDQGCGSYASFRTDNNTTYDNWRINRS